MRCPGSWRQLLLPLLLVIVEMTQVCPYRILGIFPHTGKSHHIMFEPLLRALGEKGHELTVVSHYPMKDPPKTYKDISLAGTMKLNLHVCDFEDFLFLSGVGSILRHIMATYELFDLANLNCQAMTGHPDVKAMVASNTTFDLIMTEQFNSDCALGVVSKFRVPVVGIATHVPMPWTRRRFGMPENPAFVPNHFLKHCRNPTMLEAVESFIVNTYYKIVYYISTHFLEYRFLGGSYLQSREDLDAVIKNLSLLFVTTYFPLHGSVPQAPNVVEIGGVHLPDKTQKLDEDIKKFLDESENGVIYFSMGSMIRGKSLPLDKLKAFQNAFAKLPYKVLWKWENETMPGITPNIMIKQWMPQYEILSHEKVKAFIGHGGLLGLTEAVHHSVPVIVIPFFGDQFVNGMAAEESGLGRVLDFDSITEDTVTEVLNDVLSPKMVESTKRLTEIWKDRPMSPLKTAIFWIEHIAKFGGKHLRPASADLPLSRYLLLDVIGLLAVISIIVAYIYFKIVQCVWKSMFKKTKKKRE